MEASNRSWRSGRHRSGSDNPATAAAPGSRCCSPLDLAFYDPCCMSSPVQWRSFSRAAVVAASSPPRRSLQQSSPPARHQALPRHQARRLSDAATSSSSSAVLSNTTSFLRNLHNGAEVRNKHGSETALCASRCSQLTGRCMLLGCAGDVRSPRNAFTARLPCPDPLTDLHRRHRACQQAVGRGGERGLWAGWLLGPPECTCVAVSSRWARHARCA